MLILDQISSTLKPFLYSFWGREDGLKADKICKLFSHLNIVYIILVLCVYKLRMNTFTLHHLAAQVLSAHNC